MSEEGDEGVDEGGERGGGRRSEEERSCGGEFAAETDNYLGCEGGSVERGFRRVLCPRDRNQHFVCDCDEGVEKVGDEGTACGGGCEAVGEDEKVGVEEAGGKRRREEGGLEGGEEVRLLGEGCGALGEGKGAGGRFAEACEAEWSVEPGSLCRVRTDGGKGEDDAPRGRHSGRGRSRRGLRVSRRRSLGVRRVRWT